MKLIALTGGIGAGKSTVSSILEKLGAYVINADEASRELMQPEKEAYKAILNEFGNKILLDNKEIDRKALAEIVFSDKAKLAVLNKITHPLIYAEMRRRAELSKHSVVCMEIPLLFSTECPIKFDMSVAVITAPEIRIERVMKRDGATRKQAELRIANQLPDSELCRLADYVIENNNDTESVYAEAEKLYRGLIESEENEE